MATHAFLRCLVPACLLILTGTTPMTATASEPIAVPTAAPAPGALPTDAEGFAFLDGRWRVFHHQMKDAFAAKEEWVDYEGRARFFTLLDGLVSVEELRTADGRPFGGAMRTFDRTQRTWSDAWVSAGNGVLQLPQHGRFVDGVGTWESEDGPRRQAHVGARRLETRVGRRGDVGTDVFAGRREVVEDELVHALRAAGLNQQLPLRRPTTKTIYAGVSRRSPALFESLREPLEPFEQQWVALLTPVRFHPRPQALPEQHDGAADDLLDQVHRQTVAIDQQAHAFEARAERQCGFLVIGAQGPELLDRHVHRQRIDQAEGVRELLIFDRTHQFDRGGVVPLPPELPDLRHAEAQGQHDRHVADDLRELREGRQVHGVAARGRCRSLHTRKPVSVPADDEKSTC